MANDQKIKSVVVVCQQGSGDFHAVGQKGVTDIRVDFRQISDNVCINIIEVFCGEHIIKEISMNTPYILTYFD